MFEQTGPHATNLLVLKNILCLVFGVGVLWTIVLSGYELASSLYSLRAYSLLVVLLEGVCRYLTPASSSEISAIAKAKTKKHSKIFETFLVVLLSVCSVIGTHVVVVLFGAYVIENIEATFTLSLLVASLAFIRPLITLGRSAVINLLERQNIESEVKSFAVLVATWAGAFPIPLDWDRPWQVWPLTCSIGAILGELGASVYFLSVLWSKGGTQWKNKAR
ncbi:phosphatidylinositol-glycan biosynthesis class F protein-like [Scylla paramamosain]